MDSPSRDRRQWSDSALLSAIAARDGTAFAVFYRRHLPAVLAFLLRETGDPTVLVSVNGGASFGRHPAPSPGLPCEFQAQSAPVIWAHCATGTESGVWYSSDFGANFVSGQRVGGAPPLPNSAVFAAASNTTAVVGYQQLYRTADSGATYTPVKITQSPAADSQVVAWAYLGFTNSTHGIGLGYVGSVAQANERPFYTTDAGQSYHLVPLP